MKANGKYVFFFDLPSPGDVGLRLVEICQETWIT